MVVVVDLIVAVGVVQIQPSSAVVERFFSLLKGHTTKKQSQEKTASMERRGIIMYNDRQ